MKNLNKIAVSTLLATSGLLFVGQSANAMPSDVPALNGQNVSCSIRVITPEVPAVPGHPAVWEAVTVPITETLHEFVFANEHGQAQHEPRWEKEGWNADGNPNSKGWTSTGVTKEVETGEVKTEYVLLAPAVEAKPAIPAVTEEECITEPSAPETPVTPETPAVTPEPEVPAVTPEPETPAVTPEAPAIVPVVETPVPVDTRNCAEIGQTNILAGTDLYRPDLDRDSDGVGCETGVTGEPVADAAPQQNIVGQVPVTSTTAVSVPLSNSGDVQAPPTQLAYTGAQEDLNWTLGILGASALVGGSILIGLKRKLA